jgi:hypothetical protein
MMRLAQTVAQTAILLAKSAVNGDEGARTPDYYPLAEGTKWHYRVDNGQKQFAAVFRISKIENVDGTPSQVINWYADGIGVVKQSLTIEGKTTVLEMLELTPGK